MESPKERIPPHLGRDLISLDSAGVPLDQTATENHALVKASFKHENAFYRVRKGDPFLGYFKVRFSGRF